MNAATPPAHTGDEAPLAGYLVVDFTRVMSGPYCTRLLADMGANVVKIERPGEGDEVRYAQPQLNPQRTDQSAYFARLNAGKRSIALDSRGVRRVANGGYPEVQTRPAGKRRDAWFASYLTTILSRDMRDLTGLDALTELPRVLKALAARTANLLNYADVARDLGVPVTTLRRHVGLLTATFLVHELPAWSINLPKRLVKAPKAFIADTGLAAHLLGVTVGDPALGQGYPYSGALVETFVANELLKQISWHDQAVTLHHFRTHVGEEVDFVLEAPDGTITGVEVKLSATLTSNDVRGLKVLREAAGKRFRRGIVLYTGKTVVPLDEQLTAVPMRNLWS